MSFFPENGSSELRELFFETASELLQALNDGGLELEQHPEDGEVVRRVRRTVHTLKGDSAAAGFPEISSLAHELEDVLTAEMSVQHGSAMAELVLRAADSFGEMLAIYGRGATPAAAEDVKALIRKMAGAAPADAKPSTVVPYKLTGRFAWSEYEQLVIADAAARGQVIYNVAVAIDPACPGAIALQMIRNVLQQTGTILALFPDDASQAVDVLEAAVATSIPEEQLLKKLRVPAVTANAIAEQYVAAGSSAPIVERLSAAAAEPAAQTDTTTIFPEPAKDEAPETQRFTTAENTLRVDSERIDTVLNLVGELVIAKSMLAQAVNEFDKRFVKDPLRAKFADALAFQQRVLTDLQKSVMKIRMVPVEQLFRRFPRVIRDVAKACGKDVTLEIAGESTDLDKSILDMLAEPLSHLVRNAVDHGIESAADRQKNGKPATGKVSLNAYHQGNQIVIECSDDGRGINREKLVAKAIARGVISPDEALRLNEGEALQLVFHPGLSTAEQVTEISGRGVGMDVVKTVITQLKGEISIDTQLGAGTTFRIKVPLTLAIIKAMMFRSADRLYAVPLASVVEITRASESEVHRVDQNEVLQLRGEVLTLLRVNRLNRQRGPQSPKFFCVVVQAAERKYGIVVDKLVGEEELVIKALDDHLVATDYVSGASILGDGTVVLILNLQALITKLSKAPAAAMGASA